MNGFNSLRPITRRELRVEYISPPLCQPAAAPASGSGSGSVSVLDMQPVVRLPGPQITLTVDSGSVTLDWQPVTGAFAYVVYRSTSASGPFSILISGLLTTFHVDAPASPGTYYYKVTAIEPDSGETEPSAVLSATV